MGNRQLALATFVFVSLAANNVAAQYCQVSTTYFSSNYSRPGCAVGTCWAPSPFLGSIAITGSQYPSSNYDCATTAPGEGALENTLYTYDGNGNLTVSKDPLGRSTTNTYDALNRLTQVRDTASGTTKYAYDGKNLLKQITDPRNLVTAYTLNGFGETTVQASPDTGSTTHTYDPAGNLLTRLDARGVTATYTFDALNRVTRVVHSKGGSPSETHTFTYDTGTNGKGRLTGLSDTAGTTSWAYEAHGRVTAKTQVVAGVTRTVGYAYNAAGQLARLTTPSGLTVTYTYSNNRIASIALNGTPVITGARTAPFGALTAWQWGNGLLSFRDHDGNGRLMTWETVHNDSNMTPLFGNVLAYDVASRITAVSDPATATTRGSYQYDNLDRLTVAQKGNPVTSTQQFAYDAVGNRSSKTIDGQLTNYAYPASSNRLSVLTGVGAKSYIYDGAGNPTAIGTASYVYNLANRLTAVTGLASYRINALGQRLSKTVGATTTLFVYDEQGRLIGEYDASGTMIQETVWLEDLPVATLRPTGSGNPPPIAIYYVHPDHLGSPRAITRPSDNRFMWRWDNIDPFGANLPNENPGGQGTFRYALRFPGQYYDAEIGTHYNYFRDFDPTTGRYFESDPIGLGGGINTYLYVRANPIAKNDRLGLFAYHGNWCGPDWTGGFRREYGQIGPGDDILTPIDALDRCCMVHDVCYWKCRCDNGCGESRRRNCMKSCDRALADCAAAAGAHRGSPLWWWMNYGKPSPGPNAPSCSGRQ